MNNERTLLLVDDEENILRCLARTLRRDGYKILTASSGEEGLNVLAQNNVGVIVSDQRMPGMNGSEFLSRAREQKPETVRIMLSGYTELTSVTDAINQGAIFKFLTKPWEDELLRKNINDAFHHYELRRENIKLTNELSELNKKLEEGVKERTHELQLSLRTLQMEQDVLEVVPCAIIGIDKEGMVVNANEYAHKLFGKTVSGMLSKKAKAVLPADLYALLKTTPLDSMSNSSIELDNKILTVNVKNIGDSTIDRGIIMACMLVEQCHA